MGIEQWVLRDWFEKLSEALYCSNCARLSLRSGIFGLNFAISSCDLFLNGLFEIRSLDKLRSLALQPPTKVEVVK